MRSSGAPPAGRSGSPAARPDERRFATILIAPALAVVLLVAIFPLGWTVWESFHTHDLRMPWLGTPFTGLANYAAVIADARFWSALGHTLLFMVVTVSAELALGLVFALAMHAVTRGRGVVRAAIVVPWAIPTVVVALLWRFLFDSQAGIANVILVSAGLLDEPLVWFSRAFTAWIPVMLADIWKTTPFVALLLLAGLQTIDSSLHEAAAVDGAGRWQRLRYITLPLLRPAVLVALVFRSLDAFRVFDLIYVLTGGGPGTSTEPVALYTFSVLLRNLQFGYGAALSVCVFAMAATLSVLYVKGLRAGLVESADG